MRLHRWITSSFRVSPQPASSRSCCIEQLENRTMLSATVASHESTPMAPLSASALNVSGTAKKWHTITIDFAGPTAKQTDTSPNPFKDYRLQVRFNGPNGKTYNVPGYFDGDGKGGSTGNIWRVKFTPDERGTWNYQASFRKGTNVAIDLSSSAGTPTHFDGATGSFTVGDRDPNAPGVLKWGRLEYVGGHYLKYRDGGYFLKTGSNEPENLLGYSGFVNTPTQSTATRPTCRTGAAAIRIGVADWARESSASSTTSTTTTSMPSTSCR